MTPFKVRAATHLHGKQILIYLEDEQTGAHGPSAGTDYLVRLSVPDAPELIRELVDAYQHCVQKAMLDLAAGGCRTCGNTRKVDGKECPVCMPRAEKRLRERLFVLRPWGRGS